LSHKPFSAKIIYHHRNVRRKRLLKRYVDIGVIVLFHTMKSMVQRTSILTTWT